MIRLPGDDSLPELRLTAFDVIFRTGDRFVAHWNGIDPELLSRTLENRAVVMARRSQRSNWRHPDDPGYVLKEPGKYQTLLTFPDLPTDTARRLKGALTAIGDQRDLWAHQTPELIGHPGPRGHLADLARDALYTAETLGFHELVEPLRRLTTALDTGLEEAPEEPSAPSAPMPTVVLRIGAPTDVPLGSRPAALRGGRVWGDDGRPLQLPSSESRTDTELARLWERIVGSHDANLWIAPDGRVIVPHIGRHWILDVIGDNRPVAQTGKPLVGWVIERCHPLLDTDGSVWDYATGKSYFDAASQPGIRLLAVLPDGGPLQVTADGAVGARDDESGESLYVGVLTDDELDAFLR